MYHEMMEIDTSAVVDGRESCYAHPNVPGGSTNASPPPMQQFLPSTVRAHKELTQLQIITYMAFEQTCGL